MKIIFKPTSLLQRRWVFSCLGLGFTLALTSCSNSNSQPRSVNQPPAQSSRTPQSSKVNSSSDSSYLGLSPEAATTAATAAGLRCRVVNVDGVSQHVTKDYRPSRLNFAVEKGKIVKVTKG